MWPASVAWKVQRWALARCQRSAEASPWVASTWACSRAACVAVASWRSHLGAIGLAALIDEGGHDGHGGAALGHGNALPCFPLILFHLHSFSSKQKNHELRGYTHA